MTLRCLALVVFGLTCLPLVTLAGPRVLFVRGGAGTGGFLEGGQDDQLCDIADTSTRGGNHGWATFADWLRSNNFELEQVEEGPVSNNTPVPFDTMDLSAYDVILLGSNNAAYTEAQVDAVMAWVRAGGGLLAISDANFGQDWHDAPDSDQTFFDRLGWIMNQDFGTYALNSRNFALPDHPILDGVNSFDGEGVSPILLDRQVPGVRSQVVVRAQGQTRRNNRQGSGSLISVTDNHAALIIAEVEEGRVAGHYDRNTFFNRNGAGTDLTRFDNRTYALNLFNWLAFGDAGLQIGLEEMLDGKIVLASSEDTLTLNAVATRYGKKLSVFDPPTIAWTALQGEVTWLRQTGLRAELRFASSGDYRLQLAAEHKGLTAMLEIPLTVELGQSSPLEQAFGSGSPKLDVRLAEDFLEISAPWQGDEAFGLQLEWSLDLRTWQVLEVEQDFSEAGRVRLQAKPAEPAGYLRLRVTSEDAAGR